MFIPVLKSEGVDTDKFTSEYITRVVALVKDRINFVKDLWAQSKFFFVEPVDYDAKAVKKRWSEQMPLILSDLIDILKSIEDFSSASQEQIVLAWIAEHGYHLGNVMNAFRLTVVGECKGPHMFDITELLGKEETIRRIELGIERIKLPQA